MTSTASKPRRASKAFSDEEVDELISLISSKRRFIEGREADSIQCRELKRKAWESIARDFAASGVQVCHRSWDVLKAKWKSLKCAARKVAGEERQAHFGTGGGPFVLRNHPNYIRRVQEVLQEATNSSTSMTGHLNRPDSDAVVSMTAIQTSQPLESTVEHTNESDHTYFPEAHTEEQISNEVSIITIRPQSSQSLFEHTIESDDDTYFAEAHNEEVVQEQQVREQQIQEQQIQEQQVREQQVREQQVREQQVQEQQVREQQVQEQQVREQQASNIGTRQRKSRTPYERQDAARTQSQLTKSYQDQYYKVLIANAQADETRKEKDEKRKDELQDILVKNAKLDTIFKKKENTRKEKRHMAEMKKLE